MKESGRTWVVWLAALAMIGLTARLGWWQLDRAAQKTALQQARQQQAKAPPLALPTIPATVEAARAAEYRRVAVAGRWLPQHTVYLDNRPMAGRFGFYVMTPLALDDGRFVLVQRGWSPRDAGERTRIAAPPPPTGPVQVQGRVALAPARLFALAPEVSGPIRQNLDLAAYASETRLPLLPWVLVQEQDAQAADDGLLRQWPEPAVDVRKHHGYAVQWFALATLVAGLLLWFRVLRPWRLRRRDRTS